MVGDAVGAYLTPPTQFAPPALLSSDIHPAGCSGTHGGLTTERCSHYPTFEFSLPIAALTTGPSNSHYRSMFSLPDFEFSLLDLRILTTDRCSHYRTEKSRRTDARLTTEMRSHPQPGSQRRVRDKRPRVNPGAAGESASRWRIDDHASAR